MFGEHLPAPGIPVELWEYWLGKQPIERGMHRSFRSMGEEFGQNSKPYLAGVIITRLACILRFLGVQSHLLQTPILLTPPQHWLSARP